MKVPKFRNGGKGGIRTRDLSIASVAALPRSNRFLNLLCQKQFYVLYV